MSVAAQVRALEDMNVAQLRVRWKEEFGEETKQRHRRYLIKRLAWKLQVDQLPKLTPDQEARVQEYMREYEAMPPEKWFPNALTICTNSQTVTWGPPPPVKYPPKAGTCCNGPQKFSPWPTPDLVIYKWQRRRLGKHRLNSLWSAGVLKVCSCSILMN